MATQRFDDRGLVVTAPDAVRVVRVAQADAPASGAGRAWRATARGAGADPVLAALGEAGFARIDALDLLAPAGATRAGLGAPAVEVEVASGQEAVVLVASADGAYHWMLPAEAEQTTRAGFTRVRRFEFRFGRPGGDPATRRSLLSRAASLRAWVLRFVVTGAAARIDGAGPFGLVPMATAAPDAWQAGPVARPAASGGDPPRILLAVHGTFSSTRTFAPLAVAGAGGSFLGRAAQRYALVLGFDHKTLGDGAETNAADLMCALEAIAPPEGLIVDAFAHSRGGLILRAAIETATDDAARRIRFARVAFVGCPLAGTHLADARNWRALTDLYTTLAMAAAGAAAPVTPAASAAGVALAAAVAGLGRFVQALARSAVDEDAAPGLRSMLPDGPLVRALADAAARPTGAQYATISSDFEPDLAPGLQAPLATLKGMLVDRLADDLFRGANDLVVDTASMGALKPYVLGERGDLALGRNGLAYHTAYFQQARVVDGLAAWFGLPEASATGPGAGAIGRPAAAEGATAPGTRSGGLLGADGGPRGGRVSQFSAARHPRPDEAEAGRATWSWAVEVGGEVAEEGIAEEGVAEAVVVGEGTAEATPTETTPAEAALEAAMAESPPPADDGGRPGAGGEGPGADVSCTFAAEMPPSLQAGAEVDLAVTLAREAVATAAGAIAATGSAAVSAAAALDIRVQAVSGCAVVGGGEASYPVPAMGRPTRHTARIRGSAPGRAKVAIDILQRARVLCSLLLEPMVYADPAAPIAASASVLVPAAAVGGALVLRIYEDSRDGRITLTFVADCDDPPVNVEDKTEIRSGSIDEVTAQIYRGIERYTPETLEFARFEREMAVLGRTLWRQLIPPEIAGAIVENRDRIAAIQVVSGSCRLPWELVRLPGPDAEALSFAEMGLVRWLPNCPWPGRRLSLAAGTVIRPTYDGTDDLDPLPHAIDEVAAVTAILPHLRPLDPATWDAVYALLGAGGFDVLHFAGHGAAGAELLLEQPTIVLGLGPGGHHDLFQSDGVADCFSAAGRRPIVFLNACQAGRASRSFLGIDGFARAFLLPGSRSGAAAFIAPLWSVGDLQAKLFAGTFYDRIARGGTLVEAVKSARTAARRGEEATWLSYTVYGDPFARIA